MIQICLVAHKSSSICLILEKELARMLNLWKAPKVECLLSLPPKLMSLILQLFPRQQILSRLLLKKLNKLLQRRLRKSVLQQLKRQRSENRQQPRKKKRGNRLWQRRKRNVNNFRLRKKKRNDKLL